MKETMESCDVLVALDTGGADVLRVQRDDPIFSAALDLLSGRNVLFIGPTGSGKSLRSLSLQISGNYPSLLAGTRWENIEVEIKSIEIDLITVLANLELNYDCVIENGTSSKIPANIAAFILLNGHLSKTEFMAEKKRNETALRNGLGKIIIRVLHVDDFDRTQHPSIQNSFMKFIENQRHTFHWNPKDPERYLNLQCVASSNSICGTSQGKYIAAKGVDLAVYNRFFVYHVEEQMYAEILKNEFAPQYHGFIEKLVNLSMNIKKEITEGSLTGVGEISLRQIRPIVEQHIHAGVPEIQAARKLLSAVSKISEENIRVEFLINSTFGKVQLRRFAF